MFGASKVAADVLVQEYGRYFGLKTACFRGGCLTGPGHSGAELHGFLSYLVKCAVTGTAVHGVRLQGQAGPRQHPLPRSGQRLLALLPGAARRRGLQHRRRPASNCSMLEAIAIVERLTGRPLKWSYSDINRCRRSHLVGQRHPEVPSTLPGLGSQLLRSSGLLKEIHDEMAERLATPEPLDAARSPVARRMGSRLRRRLLSVVIPAHDEEGRIAADCPRYPHGAFSPPASRMKFSSSTTTVRDRTEADPAVNSRAKFRRFGTSTTHRRTDSGSPSALD